MVYYSGNVALPEGVAKPSDVSNAYQEAMGGQWFYMDYSKGKGLGATPLGTVKTARYVRVYSKNPQSGKNNVDFMERAVYGYEEERSVQKTTGLRRQIDNEHPLMIATAYSNDVYEIGQDKGPDLQGWNTAGGRWDAIPDDLKPYNVMLLHTNNLRQFSPDHISQAYLQEFHEHGLQIAYEKNELSLLSYGCLLAGNLSVIHFCVLLCISYFMGKYNLILFVSRI